MPPAASAGLGVSPQDAHESATAELEPLIAARASIVARHFRELRSEELELSVRHCVSVVSSGWMRTPRAALRLVTRVRIYTHLQDFHGISTGPSPGILDTESSTGYCRDPLFGSAAPGR